VSPPLQRAGDSCRAQDLPTHDLDEALGGGALPQGVDAAASTNGMRGGARVKPHDGRGSGGGRHHEIDQELGQMISGLGDEGNTLKGLGYCVTSTKNSIPSCVHQNRIWN
jgi:hypothetical protein